VLDKCRAEAAQRRLEQHAAMRLTAAARLDSSDNTKEKNNSPIGAAQRRSAVAWLVRPWKA